MQLETIATAWRRAEMTGLDPLGPRGFTVSPVDPTSRLLTATRSVLDRMESIFSGTNVSVILADRDVRLVDLRHGTTNIRDALGENGGVLGRDFTEETSGTNSVATVHELRAPLTVHGDQHFLDSMKKFSCYGYPIIHPLTRRIEGVLDLTFFVGEDNPLLHPMVRHAAEDIEAQLLEQSPRDEQALVGAFQRAAVRRRGAPLVGITGDLVLANTAATALLNSVDFAVLGALTDVSPVQAHTLSSGAQVTLRLTRATLGAGVVMEIDPLIRTAGSATSRSARSRVERVKSQVADARAAQKTMSVVGERGTGRTTLVQDLMADADPALFDAGHLAHEPQSAWLQRLTQALDVGEHPVVIENVHLLSPLAAHAVRVALARTSAWFVLSSDPLNTLSPEVFQLVDTCTARLELLPLRLRKHEIPALVEAMLSELSSTVRFTPAAFRTLLAHNWPGNVSELRAEVTAAARSRSAGDISERDLVRLHDRATAPALSANDTALRVTLEEALARHGGNKLAAARSLDISRTTLYKRMHAYGLSAG
jgi:transcriptional regulator of acetoin/glycerol metabolism